MWPGKESKRGAQGKPKENEYGEVGGGGYEKNNFYELQIQKKRCERSNVLQHISAAHRLPTKNFQEICFLRSGRRSEQ